jgi:Secretion system C-terminal sorting domain
MKTLIYTLLFVFLANNLKAQWAPEGATWHYGEGYAFSGDIGYMEFVAEGDTVIQGITCQKIRKYGKVACLGRPWMEYTYEENDVIYYYNPLHDEFQILYDFTAEPDDTWVVYTYDSSLENQDTITVLVDSVNTININGVESKRMFVHYLGFSTTPGQEYEFSIPTIIIERLGDIYYMFNFWPASYQVCDANYSTGLRCYQDDLIGLYDLEIAESCLYTGLSEINKNDRIKIYPNPFTETVMVESDLAISPKKYIIRNLSGKLVQKGVIMNNEILLKKINSGIFLLELYAGDNELLSLNKLIKM